MSPTLCSRASGVFLSSRSPSFRSGSTVSIACEKVEKSKKLLKLTVKVGEETRTVVSGIALHYTPEQLIGKKLAMITNLKPAKLCGIVSEGMIVCAEDENGNIAYLTPEKDIADGSQIF